MSMSSSFLLILLGTLCVSSNHTEIQAAGVLCIAITITGDEICKALRKN